MTIDTPVAAAPTGATHADQPAWGGEGARDVWPTAPQEALLGAALLPDERALEAWERVLPLIDLPTMDGSTQALLPSLRGNLLRLGVEHPFLELFKGVQRHIWARNQLLLARMTPVVGALEEAGIPTMLLKGAALLADTQMHVGMRSMGDVDVLVPTGRTPEAVDVLAQENLFPVEGMPAWYVLEYAPRFSPSYGFRDVDDLQLDLHWHALHASCQPDADEDFWAASRPTRLGTVDTRVLCPADELLLVIMHGLRWSATPTYRWVVDAALIARGLGGEVDYDRLVRQARRRRTAAGVRSGLAYLRRAAGVEIPAGIERSLRAGSVDRAEARALTLAPRHRDARDNALVLEGQILRRELALGRRATPWALRRARRSLREAPPVNQSASTIGSDRADPPSHALPFDLDLADPDSVRAHAVRGVWPPERGGAWLSSDAAFAIALADPAPGGLVLDLTAHALEPAPQRVHVEADGHLVAELDVSALATQHVVIPAAGRRLELRLRIPGARAPAATGLGDDARELGVFVHSLRLRRAAAVGDGTPVSFGQGGDEEELLAGGWGPAEPAGRWTVGAHARLLLTPSRTVGEIELDAVPLVAPGGHLHATLSVNGEPAAELTYREEDWNAPPRRLPVSAPSGRPLVLELAIDSPVSPLELGESQDARPLGLRFRGLTLREAPSPAPPNAAVDR